MSEEQPDQTVEKTKPGAEKWLDAYHDPVASLYTLTQCVALSDIQADGDWKLVIADLGTGSYDMKLKVYKGTNLMSENAIIDLPTGVVTFYMDILEPRMPAIAVASGPYIYIYKNLRPYFKFTLPTLDVNTVELDLWTQVKEEKINVFVLREMLEGMRAEGTVLTVRSLRFLQMTDIGDMEAFANLYKHMPMRRQTVISCLSTMKKSMADEDAICCLVLGTENKAVYVLDPEAFTVLTTIDLPSVPVFLSVTGLYDVEYRIVVACRNGCIYTLKRGTSDVSKNCIELNSQPVGLERINKTIYVGTMDEMVHCYTSKGKKLWTVKMPAAITTMETMDYKSRGFKAVIVALNNCKVHIYKEKYLVNVISTDDVVTGLKFGRFGREDGTLVMTTRGGGLVLKILRRNATFEEKDISAGPPVAQNTRLNVPKKTKLFVDQTMRERDNAVTMHRTFQRDLYLLRLNTAREYVKSLENSMNPVSADPTEPLKLNAQVQGIGPTFKLTVNLQNTSLSHPSTNLLITFQYDDRLYTLKKSLIEVPMLVPGLSYAFETFVECLNDKGVSDNLKVFVLKEGKSIPIITGVISMPVSESLVVA
ncbi:Bardet-Biedl syndrome 1 protein homolog isoform X2 [Pecten maximus]|uniref:Bardet-Biedl syndrome 1 protein homolog isoform X1 n=1 Tax=Pecten maximus TaxID=6579 RepID=UPI00145823F4|nr:Bardet-Biedl syndrome 1 protein homolog isoform X1 [Pecten maximus]XP_033734847.1 Bardet-Biedl syndrome 1 protein homolog isoform X2 [Pecten maximus]